jgi:hypothetical protein
MKALVQASSGFRALYEFGMNQPYSPKKALVTASASFEEDSPCGAVHGGAGWEGVNSGNALYSSAIYEGESFSFLVGETEA